MTTAIAGSKSKTFIIMGPEMVRGRSVLNAISALYYLPKHFRLVFAGNPQDQSFYNEIVSTVERFRLGDRVRFVYELESADAVITSRDDDADMRAVHGDSPEAIASAVLHLSRM